MKYRVPTQFYLTKIYDIIAGMPSITHLDVNAEHDEDGEQVFRIRYCVNNIDYPDVLIYRGCAENMTDEDVRNEIRKEMKAWESKLARIGKHISNGAPSTNESQATERTL